MARRRDLAIAAATLATGAAAAFATRRALAALDAADANRPDVEFSFPSGAISRVTTGDGATIVTESVGAGPVVVLVHGIISSRQDWGPVARLLVEQGRTVVGVDQRGHGDSTVGADGYGASRLGRDLSEVVADLDLRNLTLVGHSMGGIAAMIYALDHADAFAARVDRLVLVATSSRTPKPLRRLGPYLLGNVIDLARFDPAVARPAAAQALFGRFGSTRLVRAARTSGLRADAAQVERCAAGLATYNIRARLGAIRADTRCIYGTRDLVTPALENRYIAARIPGATRREIQGGGHLLLWTHPGEIAEQILAS